MKITLLVWTTNLSIRSFLALPFIIDIKIKNVIRTLTFSLCFMGRRIKTQQEFADSGLPISAATWMRLQAVLLHSRQLLKKADDSDNLSSSIVNFFAKNEKGSKQFRRILYNSKRLSANPENLRTVIQYSNLVDLPVPSATILMVCLGNWNKSFICNDFRNFLFLLRNNSLPLNNRINAFDNTVSPLCSFCRIVNRETRTRESFSHFFINCPVTYNLLFQWTRELNPTPDINTPEFRNLYWFGQNESTEDPSGTIGIVMDTFKYVLWKFKQRRHLPNFISLSREITFLLNIACIRNQYFRHKSVNINLIANLFQAPG